MITFTEVEEFLAKLGIGRAEYRINETPIDCTPCIQYDGKTTEVFTAERGIRLELQAYNDPLAGMPQGFLLQHTKPRRLNGRTCGMFAAGEGSRVGVGVATGWARV